MITKSCINLKVLVGFLSLFFFFFFLQYSFPLDTASFTFSLDIYPQSDHTGTVPNPVALDQTLYFKASVSTTSSSPNLDIYVSACWASRSNNPDSKDGYVALIVEG